jgi:hypothetical protein
MKRLPSIQYAATKIKTLSHLLNPACRKPPLRPDSQQMRPFLWELWRTRQLWIRRTR